MAEVGHGGEKLGQEGSFLHDGMEEYRNVERSERVKEKLL